MATRLRRKYARSKMDNGQLFPFGLVTILRDEGSTFIRVGFSLCNPKDAFNKKMARQISDGRARTGKYTCDINDPSSVALLISQLPTLMEDNVIWSPLAAEADWLIRYEEAFIEKKELVKNG